MFATKPPKHAALATPGFDACLRARAGGRFRNARAQVVAVEDALN